MMRLQARVTEEEEEQEEEEKEEEEDEGEEKKVVMLYEFGFIVIGLEEERKSTLF